MSPSPPHRKSGKDALLRGRSPDSRPKYFPSLRAFPSSWDSGFSSRISLPFTVARAVAALHRSSRTPLAHRDYQREPQRAQKTLCNHLFVFQQAKGYSIYGAEIDEWVKAWCAETKTPSISCAEDRG